MHQGGTNTGRVLARVPGGGRWYRITSMAKGQKQSDSPRIENRRAWHEYFIEAKLECGIALVGSEVKSLREGKATLQDAYAAVERGQLILFQCHIDPYVKAAIAFNHEPTRPRKLLA